MEESNRTNQQLIAEFPKNLTEKVRVSLSELKCQTYLDLRIFYQADNNAWLPTKKGITLNVEHLGELRQAIDKAIAAVEVDAQPAGEGEPSPKSTDDGMPF